MLPTTVAIPTANTPVQIDIDHFDGNQGVLINNLSITGTDAADFVITSSPSTPFLISTVSTQAIMVEYTGTATSASATLNVFYSGGQTDNIQLTFGQ